MNTQTHEEVTTVENAAPSQVVRKTVRVVDPAIKEEAPQSVFNKKKRIFRLNQIIWYILGCIEVLLAFRIVLKALGSNPYVGFTSLIYSVTGPLAFPFRGIVGESSSGSMLLEWSSIFAAVVYLVIAAALVYLLDLVNPISKEEVVREV